VKSRAISFASTVSITVFALIALDWQFGSIVANLAAVSLFAIAAYLLWMD
jgi:hypothetical protein